MGACEPDGHIAAGGPGLWCLAVQAGAGLRWLAGRVDGGASTQ
jgi:hypothetical protein